MTILQRICYPSLARKAGVTMDADDREGNKLQLGQRVEHLDGKQGTIKNITGDYIKVEWDDRFTSSVKSDQLMALR